MIIFSRRLVEELEEHALKERTNEACGILAGRKNGKKIVERVYRCRNTSRHPESRYTIDSGEMLQVFKDVENRGLEILGFYHSHSFAMNHPSNVDEEMATWPEHSYVIVSISNRASIASARPRDSRPPDGIRSWVWDGEKFVEEEVCYD